MSGGFSNPIVGGGGALVYPSIHSPNFQLTPLTGWAIDKNGNAYFQTLTVGGGVVRVTFASSAPSSPNTGDVWFNLSNGTVSYWNGSVWTNFQYGTNAIANAAITNPLLAAWAVDGLIASAGFHGLNMIPDPQFSNAAITSLRTSDPRTTGTWTVSGGAAQVTAGSGIFRLALLPSALTPIWVNPGEQYFVSVTVTTTAAITCGIELADGGAGIGTVSQSVNGTATISGVVTVPSGHSSAYIRLFTLAATGSPTATFSNPVCQPATISAPVISGGTISGTTFNGVDWQITSQGLFFYAGSPATGNLVASIAPNAGTNDGFGNPFPAGFSIGQPGTGQIQLQPNVNQAFDITSAITGVFTAMAQYFTGDSNQMMPSMLGSVLLGSGTATKMSAVMHSPFAAEGAVMLLESQNDGGTDTPVITFGTVTMPDGMTMVFVPIMTLTPYALVLYSGSGSQVVVSKTSGSGTIPIPVGVTTAKAECWAGGGGSGGSSNQPGAGGGGGEYAAEPSLAVTGGGTVSYSVGAGGSAGPAGTSGTGGNGGASTLAGTSVTVTAHGGGGGLTDTNTGPGGSGGTGSTNTTHFNGGNGGFGTQGFSQGGGGGGGGSAGVASAGNNGGNTSTGTGGTGGAAVSGGGAGGNGGNGNAGQHGSAGSAPGGGAGGAGGQPGGGLTGAVGAHGQVRLTYTNGVPVVGFSINFGAAFTDQFGTSIPAGINTATKITESGGLAVTGGTTTDTLTATGQVTATGGTPASPTVVTTDSWHLLTLTSPYTNQSGAIRCSYRLTTDNSVEITGTLNGIPSGGGGTVGTLPAGYRPAASTFFPVGTFGGTAALDSAPYCSVNTSGVITAPALPAGTSAIIINAKFPLGIT